MVFTLRHQIFDLTGNIFDFDFGIQSFEQLGV